MPPTARLPTVEVQSLLRPPIRMQLRTLQTLARPQCASLALRRTPPVATCHVQRRPLHLYKTARAKTALGMHKVLEFDSWAPKRRSESTHRVNLVRYKEREEHVVIEKDLSLQELYDKHIEPGRMLYLADEVPKKLEGKYEQMRDEQLPLEAKNYAIVGPRDMNRILIKGGHTGKRYVHGLKNVVMLLSNPIGYRKLALDRAYQFLEANSPVEFRIRLYPSKVSVKGKGKFPANPEALSWVFDHFPHLRPDFILKSMPAGTRYIIRPVTDGRVIQFVLGKNTAHVTRQNLEKRLFRVKAAVEETLLDNPMGLRYQHNQVKLLGNKIVDGGSVRPMTEEEVALQKQLLITAAKKTNMTLEEKREKSKEQGKGDGPEEDDGLGLRLDSRGYRMRRVYIDAPPQKYRFKKRRMWESR